MPLPTTVRRAEALARIEVASEEIYPSVTTIDRLEALLAAGDRDAVVTTTMREVAGLPPQVVEQLRAQPSWQARVTAAHTIPRELRAVKAYRFDPARFRDLRVPTLLLAGGVSATAFHTTARAIARTLPDSRVVVLPGQEHAAMDTATDLFATEVHSFVKELP
jgi:pimeloyl-ACP methyl ester carboxylesterase